MADETDNSLYMAGGSKIFNEMQRLTNKQEEIVDYLEEEKKERLRDKAKSVSNIKKIAVTQGGKPLTTENISKLLGDVATTVTNRIGQMTAAVIKESAPIEKSLKDVNHLLNSNKDDDVEKGFDLIDKLQSRLGVDLSKYSKEMADSIQKLYDINSKRKEDKKQRMEELVTERDILREQGINTYVNEKTQKLEIKSKKEERAELKRIQIEERRIKEEEKNILKQAKELKKMDRDDKDRAAMEEKVIARSENLKMDRTKLEEDREKANIKPGERTSGMLDQTVGEAFRQIKTFGKEIVQLGGDLFKGFGKLAGMAGRLAMSFLALLAPLVPFILIAIMLGVVIFALYKVIKSVIDFFANIFEGISNIWPFSLLKDDDNETNAKTDETKNEIAGKKPPEKGYVEEGRSVEKVAPGTMQSRSDAMNENMSVDKAKILPINTQSMEEGDTTISNQSYLRTSKSSPVNLNKMSVENQALSETKSANNTVIAPNVSNSSVNASNTQAMSMEPTNFDRSFINLNTVPI